MLVMAVAVLLHGLAGNDQRIDHEDRDHADMLDGADDGDRGRRDIIAAVNESCRLARRAMAMHGFTRGEIPFVNASLPMPRSAPF